MKNRTIGEVLQELQGEFEDITISKIRFLEAEGLINPDRTTSGYRTFAAADVDRLRYVLRAQRDRYLPLRVIRDELDRIDAGLPVGEPTAAPAADDVAVLVDDHDTDLAGLGDPITRTLPAEPSLFDESGEATTLSLGELADTTGLGAHDVQALCEHGILAGEENFDADDVRAARAAAELLDNGLEARHLRMYRQFADRELALYEQLVSALLRQKNPDSRRTATDQVERLMRSGGGLHRILLTRRLRGLLR